MTMISQLLKNKIDVAFAALDAARDQAYKEKYRMPQCKETRKAFAALDACLDLIENL